MDNRSSLGSSRNHRPMPWAWPVLAWLVAYFGATLMLARTLAETIDQGGPFVSVLALLSSLVAVPLMLGVAAACVPAIQLSLRFFGEAASVASIRASVASAFWGLAVQPVGTIFLAIADPERLRAVFAASSPDPAISVLLVVSSTLGLSLIAWNLRRAGCSPLVAGVVGIGAPISVTSVFVLVGSLITALWPG